MGPDQHNGNVEGLAPRLMVDLERRVSIGFVVMKLYLLRQERGLR